MGLRKRVKVTKRMLPLLFETESIEKEQVCCIIRGSVGHLWVLGSWKCLGFRILMDNTSGLNDLISRKPSSSMILSIMMKDKKE